eukprot:175403_1
MTQPNAINSSRSTDTPNQPLLLLNDVQRRRRIKQNKQEQTKSKSQPRTRTTKSKYFIKNNELIITHSNFKHENNITTNNKHTQQISQQNMEDNLASLYADTHVSKQKSKSQLVSQNHQRLQPQTNKYRNHSKSGPPRPKLRKKRTFKLSEPTDTPSPPPPPMIRKKKKKKSRRNFMSEINNNREETPMTAPALYLAKSQSTYKPPSKNSTKKRNSFKLGSLSLTAASSFSSYQNKFNVHKPKIKPGSNQFLVSVQMRQLQEKLKSENTENEQKILTEFSNVKTLTDINSIKLPNYSGKIPLVLIELKKKLHSCDGLKQRKIFHISVKNNTAIHHKITSLIRNFFMNLPIDNRLLDNIFIDILIYVQRLTHFKQINNIIQLIPDPNKSILLWLWDLLSDTIEYSIINRMNIESLSKSMAP